MSKISNWFSNLLKKDKVMATSNADSLQDKYYHDRLNFLKDIGDKEGLQRARKNHADQIKLEQQADLYHEAENLSKAKEYKKSNNILLRIKNENGMPAVVYKRMAINYRGLKEYDKEVQIIQEFLDNKQSLYGGDQWLDVFEPRLKRAKELKEKHQSN